jgi:hypothetical protein
MKLEVKKIFGLLLFALAFLAQPVFAQNIPVNASFFTATVVLIVPKKNFISSMF